MSRRTLLAALLCSTLASAGRPAAGPERLFDVDRWVGTVSTCDALVKKELITGVGDLKRGQHAPRPPPCQ